MIAAGFCTWVNNTLLPKVIEYHPSAPSKISVRTAIRCLHGLGFETLSSKKGIYIDGHERQDVIDYRKLYLRKQEIQASTHAPPLISHLLSNPLCHQCKKVVPYFSR